MNSLVPELIYQGSVKNVRGNPDDDFVIFEFSDRYSIFDWGEMPDHLSGKGLHLAKFTDTIYSFFENQETWNSWQLPDGLHPEVTQHLSKSKAFEMLKAQGITSHRYQGDARVENLWKVKKVDVPTISHRDYSFYQSRPLSTLVPLEVIFRFGAPTGSSLLKRLEKKPDYMYALGFKQIPKEMEWFDRPIIEFSTKLESSDRYISFSEAKQIAALSEEEFDLLYAYASLLALRLKEEFTAMDLTLWDGKFEFAFVKGKGTARDFMLVDSIGPDEIRITYNNMHLSKEVLRQFYLPSKWYQQIETHKQKQENWQQEMRNKKLTPKPLSPMVKSAAEDMYEALAKAVESHFLHKTKVTNTFHNIIGSLRAALHRGEE